MAVALASLLLASACGTTTAPSTAVKPCQTSADCAAGNGCLFSVYASCGNPGVCIANVDGSACVQQTACGCNGATETVCLVNGNSPSAITALGSCDGATQQPFPTDAGGSDATVPDAQVPESGADAADGGAADAALDTDGGVDAADANVSTYGSACGSSTDCTDPVYSLCGPLTGKCTKGCTHNSQCPAPPTAGTCDTTFGVCN